MGLGRAAPLLLLAFVSRLAGLDHQTFLHITYPRKIPSNSTDEETEEDKTIQTYAIRINKKTYIVHLEQQSFLPNDFMIYTYNQGGFVQPNSAQIQNKCFYKGYIQGFPNSMAILSTCSGLRGLLQFENVSYGIEPLGSSSTFEHLVYQLSGNKIKSPLWMGNFSQTGSRLENVRVPYKLLYDTVPLSDLTKNHRYIEVYIILEKSLYSYLGANPDYVTQSIAQIIGFVNTMFYDINVTVVLSSLEFWTDQNKISTAGEPDKLLQRFLQWKNSYLVLRPHDLAFLFVYREKPNYAGAAFVGKLCIRNYDVGVALYQKSITLESFAVVFTQLLGFNLGMEYDDGKDCKCPGHICVMHTKAINSDGIKTLSSCSIKDFQNFIKFKGASCLSNRPDLKLDYKQRPKRGKSACGNGIIEAGEKCDCGTAEECKLSKCCTSTCAFQRGAVCSDELCCENCKFKPRNTVCRASIDSRCDFPEYCNGSSASCPANVYVQNGFSCASDTGFCYKGSCQSSDLRCQEIFGIKSSNAPQVCYEEVNTQTDRFGHCGLDQQKNYKTCSFRNIRCGKLLCLYPYDVPFTKMNVPVLYTPVKNSLCISLDLKQPDGTSDPLMVKEGAKCGLDKVCINQVCEDYNILKYDCDPEQKCSGRGVCNNKRNCHCDPGWAPPDCKNKGNPLGGSIDSGLRHLDADVEERSMEDSKRTWVLLSIFLFLPIIIGSSVVALKWNRINMYFFEADEREGDSESSSRSESSSTTERSSYSQTEGL